MVRACSWMVLVGLVAAFLIFIFPADAAYFSCSFKASCAANETGLLRDVNDTNGSNNAHAQLMNDTGTAYNYTLCCATDASHTLNNSCANANSTVVLNLYATENTHVQLPSVGTYNYSACMALSPGNLSCTYVNTTCAAAYSGIASIASSEPNNGQYNMTNAHIANYTYYTLNVCCKGGTSPPSVPVLVYPANNNYTVFERNITFQWTASTDPDGNPVNYSINITQGTCTSYYVANITTTNYTSAELCVDKTYNWTVQACDPNACSAWAGTWNFTIQSVAGLTLLVNNTDFGILNNSNTRNTTGGAPAPFNCQNTGNVPLNVTFQANGPLYSMSGLGNNTWQYKARENQTGAFDTGTSQMNWTNVTGSYTSLFTNLKYYNNQNSAFIDILITVPAAEPSGVKSSVVTVQGNYSG
jgi:hypothetical protein